MEGTPGCDARLRTKRNVGSLDPMSQIRFFLDKARTFYWSGIAKRKKYGAYKLVAGTSQQNQVDVNSGSGIFRTAGFAFMDGKRRDGFSPANREPFVLPGGNSERWKLWAPVRWGGSGSMGKRYHFQAEALIRNGSAGKPGAAGYMRMASDAFGAALLTVANSNDQNAHMRFLNQAGDAFNENELEIMRRWMEAGGGIPLDQLVGGLAVNAPVYEPILRDIHTGKKRKKPLSEERDERKAMGILVRKLNEMLAALGTRIRLFADPDAPDDDILAQLEEWPL